MSEFRKILVPVDFSDHSRRALEVAIELAKSFEAELHVVHCCPTRPVGGLPFGIALPDFYADEVRQAALGHLERWADKASAAGVRTHTHLSSIQASLGIAGMAEEIEPDLIVMGTRGASRLAHVLLGSVAERTVRTARCPVLTVKATDRE